VKVTSKGQITIPKEIRDEFGIRAESEVEWQVIGGVITLRKSGDRSRIRAAIERMRGTANSGMTTDEIMKLTRGDED
jgi:antitoxin PrlF